MAEDHHSCFIGLGRIMGSRYWCGLMAKTYVCISCHKITFMGHGPNQTKCAKCCRLNREKNSRSRKNNVPYSTNF